MLIFMFMNIVVSLLTAGFGIFFLNQEGMKPNGYVCLLFAILNALSALNIYCIISN